MHQSEINKYSQAQQERLFYIDFRLLFLGSINRNNLVQRFGIKEAAATRDLAAYKKLTSANTVYDNQQKNYLKLDSFVPLFNYTANQALTVLSAGIGDHFVGIHKAIIYSETPTTLHHPNIGVLATLSTAIHQQKSVQIDYCSTSSGTATREFVPSALVDNGLRWHIRGFDRKHGRFGDFVLTRISTAKLLIADIHEHEKRDNDNQWNRIVEMEIVPHPNNQNLKHPEAIEIDYGMQNGMLKVNVRAAVAGYVLRRWNVDCSEDHQLAGKEYHLWLKNIPALYGVDNLALAPGYKPISA